MNTTLISNTALFVLAVGTLTSSVEILKTKDFITGGVLFVVGCVLVILYEKLPPSTPS